MEEENKVTIVIIQKENHDEDETPYEKETGITRIHF